MVRISKAKWRLKEADRNRKVCEEADRAYAEWFGEEWQRASPGYLNEIQSAQQQEHLDWVYQKMHGRPAYPISIQELAVVLRAVDWYGKRGLSYQLVKRAFHHTSLGYQRAKVAACLLLLQRLRLITRSGPHKRGKHGTRYRRWQEGDSVVVNMKVPAPPTLKALADPVAIESNDNPFDDTAIRAEEDLHDPLQIFGVPAHGTNILDF